MLCGEAPTAAVKVFNCNSSSLIIIGEIFPVKLVELIFVNPLPSPTRLVNVMDDAVRFPLMDKLVDTVSVGVVSEVAVRSPLVWVTPPTLPLPFTSSAVCAPTDRPVRVGLALFVTAVAMVASWAAVRLVTVDGAKAMELE